MLGDRPVVQRAPAGDHHLGGEARLQRDPRPGREVLHPAQLGQAPGRVGERAGRVGPRDEHLRVDVLLGHRLGDPVPDRVELGVGIAQFGEVERDRVGHEDLHGGSCTGGVIVILEASRPDVELNIGGRDAVGEHGHHRPDPRPPRVVPRAVRAPRRRQGRAPGGRRRPARGVGPAGHEARPARRRRGGDLLPAAPARAAPRTPRRPRSTRSATTTTSATACTRPRRHTVGTPEWWAAVARPARPTTSTWPRRSARASPTSAPTPRRACARRSAASSRGFFEQHPTTDGGQRLRQEPGALRRRPSSATSRRPARATARSASAA